MNLKDLLSNTKKFAKDISKKFQKISLNIRALKKNSKDKESLTNPKQSDKPERIFIDISVSTIAKATLTIIALVLLKDFLFEVTDILVLIFISSFFAIVFNPMIDKLEKNKIPRWLGMILIYIFILLILIFFVVQIIPLVAEQLKEIAFNIKDYLEKLYMGYVNKEFTIALIPDKWNTWFRSFLMNIKVEELINYLASNIVNFREHLQKLATGSIEAFITAGSYVGDTVTIIMSFIFKLVIVVFLIFFMVIEKSLLKSFFTSLFPAKYSPYIIKKSKAVQQKISAWFHGTLILCSLMFILSLIGLLFFGIKYAITLALLTGIADVIPYLGPFIAYLTIVPVALNEGFLPFIWITIWFITIQQIEANILIPIVMKKAVGLSPIVIIISMLIGFQFLGIMGIIISIPIATSLSIFVNDYTNKVTKT